MAGSSSFTDFVAAYRPELLPSGRRLPSGASIEAPHGTTIVSLLFDGGVVMAGDRRATMGNVIANRDMEKVFAADDYSVVGIAGTAGIAIELVRLYQVELEHYEKIEGAIMSLEGKANRLASMIRGNLALAMQGLTVVPTYAGFDLESATGRIYSYDVTGGCYVEGGHHSTGSGSRLRPGRPEEAVATRASRSSRPSRSPSRRSTTPPTTTPRPAAPTSAARSGRPSPSSTTSGARFVAQRRPRGARRAHRRGPSRQPGRCPMSMPFYVPPEQVMKDRADFARKGIARGRSVIVLGYDRGIAFVAENPSRALHKVSEIYDRIAFAAVGRYNEFESLRVAGIRYADLRGYSYDRTDVTARALANTYAQTLGAVFTQESKPFEIEIVVAEVGLDRRRRPDLPAHLRRLGCRRAGLRRDGRREREGRGAARRRPGARA